MSALARNSMQSFGVLDCSVGASALGLDCGTSLGCFKRQTLPLSRGLFTLPAAALSPRATPAAVVEQTKQKKQPSRRKADQPAAPAKTKSKSSAKSKSSTLTDDQDSTPDAESHAEEEQFGTKQFKLPSIRTFQQVGAYRKYIANSISSVVSIDCGYKNLAVAQIDRVPGEKSSFQVKRWFLHPVGMGDTYIPVDLASLIVQFVKQLPPDAPVVIERQRHMSGAPSQIYHLGIIEAMIHTALFTMGRSSISMSAQRTAGYFELEKGYVQKKRSSVRVVKDLIAGNSPYGNVTVPDPIKSEFESLKKQDDYCDALLQGLAFFKSMDDVADFDEATQAKLAAKQTQQQAREAKAAARVAAKAAKASAKSAS
ncbi:hypothetical protein CAOG_003684 [Capsaspora owczarzaki ATCC 30864]|uniref:Uncharacterized protein n=2 Tax=Capsaspora owczarzaki (strain ATCC 30864) TaxID=595528 RepID=A0A0D2X2L8_CAPO3|nr:hypothetical protein CAOG_003684 [Capsaspora owczarzaki ATCC 30864]